ncbi:hypothetical protein CMI47_18630 [Candidatus Pacearchaeota archaeon]|nr:hypothetical protein [Candidatus Pacearchaeota archaeon]|tara:strand:- start:15523 stop:15723 length:201 start_codon:yes stop_codon:yes gene_type:complete
MRDEDLDAGAMANILGPLAGLDYRTAKNMWYAFHGDENSHSVSDNMRNGHQGRGRDVPQYTRRRHK